MKKALLISYLFYPDNAVGAIRPTKIAKYLNLNGYEIDVICSNNYEPKFNEVQRHKYSNNIYVDHSHLVSKYYKRKDVNLYLCDNGKINGKNQSFINKIIKKIPFKKFLSRNYRALLYLITNIDIYLEFKKKYKKMMIKPNSYQFMFSTYGPLFSHLAANFLKKRNADLFWVADFRDPMHNEETPKLFKLIYNAYQRIFIKRSNLVSVVSEGYMKRIHVSTCKSVLIHNGFDIEDFMLQDNINKKNEYSVLESMYTFVYAGALYEGKRSAKVFFEIIAELEIDFPEIRKFFRFVYIGNDAAFILKDAGMFGFKENVTCMGYQARLDTLTIMKKCRILTLITWNSKNDYGVIPGKTYELFALDKPILAIVNGKSENSELAEMINATQTGVVYEQSNSVADYLVMKQFIMNDFLLFRKDEAPVISHNRNKINDYEYNNITKKLIRSVESSMR